jgi:hypothetical protein
MTPTIGRIVLYTLDASDATQITERRKREGLDARGSNAVEAGQQYPAQVVRIFGTPATCVNLKVALDGLDFHWATSRVEGDRPGTWAWPNAQ